MGDEEEAVTSEMHLDIEAIDSDSIKTAARLRLTLEGPSEMVIGVTEILSALLSATFDGRVVGVYDGDGNPVDIGPVKIDPLAGDDPVAE